MPHNEGFWYFSPHCVSQYKGCVLSLSVSKNLDVQNLVCSKIIYLTKVYKYIVE